MLPEGLYDTEARVHYGGPDRGKARSTISVPRTCLYQTDLLSLLRPRLYGCGLRCARLDGGRKEHGRAWRGLPLASHFSSVSRRSFTLAGAAAVYGVPYTTRALTGADFRELLQSMHVSGVHSNALVLVVSP